MITVEETKQKALRRYEDYLVSVVAGDASFFPLEIRSNKQNEKDTAMLQQQQVTLFKNEKSNTGFGYTVQSEIKAGKQGNVHHIKKIEFETETDYVRFIEKETESHNFKLLVKNTLAEFPELEFLLCEKPLTLFNNVEKWNDLLAVCRYFKANPNPGLYIRELPVNVHTKFIEENSGTLSKLIPAVISGYAYSNEGSFEERFNLKTKHNLIRIRFLDERLSPLSGFKEIGIAENEINQLAISCKRVFIIENDITALIFPKAVDSIVLFGRGYNIASLKNIKWLGGAEIFYCSDIDVQGFEMLSQIRGYFPHTQSILMDELTFHTFWKPGLKGSFSNKAVPHLTDKEKEFYNYLQINNKRLEHEKIPYSWMQERISEILHYQG